MSGGGDKRSSGTDMFGMKADYPDIHRASTGYASRFFPTFGWADDVAEQLAQAEPAHYCAKASSAERSNGLQGRNSHATIKPLSLCTWLATLLLPPAAYAPRRLLVPFSGTGSEIIGGIRAGFEDIVGIDSDASYLTIARQRIAYWTGWRAQGAAPAPPDTSTHSKDTQLTLW